MSELNYISNTQIKNYASIEDLKVAIIKTLARWFPNHYVFNEDALENWVQNENSDVDILYGENFQLELSIYGENVYNLVMFAIGRYRRHGSSCDTFERILDCLEYQLGHPDIEFVTMETAISSKQQGEQAYPETSLWPTYCINENPLPIAGALAETVVYDEAEDVESLEDECERCAGWGCSTCNRNMGYTVSQVDAIEAEHEDTIASSEDDEDTLASSDESSSEYSDDDDELIMSMPLRDMNDTQIEKYVELCGRCPRDECDEWACIYAGGAIIRYSYCKFIQWHIEDQTVSNITIGRAIFDEITFTNCVFDGVYFEECVFKDIVLNNTTFKNCQFTECEMDSSIVLDKSCSVENYTDSDEDA